MRILNTRMAAVIEETNRKLPHRAGSLMVRMNSCGKPGCLSCPHGGYWYRMDLGKNGKWYSHYVGPEPTDADIHTAGVDRKVVRKACRELARLRKKREAVTMALNYAYRRLVAAERASLR